MIELCRLIWFALVGLFRSRASLEIKILALRQQNACDRRAISSSPEKSTGVPFATVDATEAPRRRKHR
jgi:hypothetical protein